MQTQKNAHATCIGDLAETVRFIRKAVTEAENRGANREWWQSTEGKAEREAFKMLNRMLNLTMGQKKQMDRPKIDKQAMVNVQGEPVNEKGTVSL